MPGVGRPLVDALWGEDPPASAATTVQSYVSRLRRVLGPGLLQRSPGGYLLAAGAESTDAGRFERLAARGRSADRPADRIRLLEEALALWRGDAFTDLAHHPPGQAEAARLAELRATCREDRAAALLTLGRFAESVADLRALTVAEPLRERPWRLLMLALHRSGRQAEALAAFRAYDGILAEEGLEPSSAIRAVQATILAEPDPAPPAEPLTAARRPPRPVTPLIGREEERAFVLDLLKEHALVTITGPAGVGKSRLAAEVAAAEASARLDGARVVHLAAVADPGRVWYAVAQELGVSGQGPDRLADALAARDMILVLDGAEHVLDAVAALVTTVLARCPGVTALVTAQERTGVAGECVVPLSPLSADGADAPAVRLFTERATAVNPAFRADGPGAAAVAALCRHLDGLPLALEMAAARMGSYTPRDLLDRLDRRFALLHGVRATEPGRHRTLRAAVDWSYRLLAPAEREVFTALSVFPASFDAPGGRGDPRRRPRARPRRPGPAGRALHGHRGAARRPGPVRAAGDPPRLRAGRARRPRRPRRRPGPARRLGRRPRGTGRRRDARTRRGRRDHADRRRPTRPARGLRLGLRRTAHRPRPAADRGAARLRLPPAGPGTRGLGGAGAGDVRGRRPGRPARPRRARPPEQGRPPGRGGPRTHRPRPGPSRRPGTEHGRAPHGGRRGLRRPRRGRGRTGRRTPHGRRPPPPRARSRDGPGIAAAYLGRPDAAREHATRLRPLADRAAAPTLAAWRHYLAGEISAAGDGIAAVHDLDTAVRTARQVGNRLIEGVALVAATACRTRHGRPGPRCRRSPPRSATGAARATGRTSGRRCGRPRSCSPGSAATATRSSSPPPSPPSARRPTAGRPGDLAALDSRARSALGPAAVAEARAAGAALGPADAALYALNAIDARSRDARPRAGVTDSG
ncbi:BTAD domain-containing putative transcriptional regulator [Actinomadura madurae]|uniref:BTAD domain-containing putative transcriptional regulator n=1 Tax=Actinomadura madurae TaxID=1993 RepID=UPI0020D20667|nr:BTAD domain-containing putative transcriptional regulator [Actinomadura madurae]MCQ0020496.1 hypothetical protein [Actinomadura madurae]